MVFRVFFFGIIKCIEGDTPGSYLLNGGWGEGGSMCGMSK